MDLSSFYKKAQTQASINQAFLKKIKQKKIRHLDDVFHEAHERVFEETDCLACANCCKTTSPIFYEKDIERVAKHLRLKPSDFIEKYLRIDEDNDYVLQQAPCPFLDSDNYCTVYESRPTACREYPHTDRKNMHQILDLTYKNTLVCPAVLKIVEEVRKKIRP
ncbi:MAG: YkgJ family cysteine cluster protein [Bacteroidetes bacterium]|nr:YkgJ family cysteine cluster protein [Bacteroidota bacterium]